MDGHDKQNRRRLLGALAAAAAGAVGARWALAGDTPRQAPEFTGITRWLNGPPQSMAALRGQVVLLDFWTLGCINCLHTLPALRDWHGRFAPKGLRMIGVHTPETEAEAAEAAVQAAVDKHQLRYPIALDTHYKTWEAWRNRYWPALYLVDRSGAVVFSHYGEGDYARVEEAVEATLRAKG